MKIRNGFSLVELLVVLMLTGVLMTGMAQVFRSTISSFYQSGDILGAQRRNRWAFDQLEDDLRMIGHTDGFKEIPSEINQIPFQIVPGGTPEVPLDSIEFFMNVPIEECELASECIAGSNQMNIRPLGKTNFLAKAGDLFFLRDGMHTEKGYLAGSPSNGLVNLMTEEEAQQTPASMAGFIEIPPDRFRYTHLANRGLMVLRPMQMIQYCIKSLKLQPNPDSPEIPCLIRRQTTFKANEQAVNWEEVPYTLVSENVCSLRMDMSVDGGGTWTRTNSADWASMVDKANNTLPDGNKIQNNNFWFKRIPLLLRADLRTRTAIARAEFSSSGDVPAFRERSMMLLIAPRNCGLP